MRTIYDIISDKLAGEEMTCEEQALLSQWLEASPENRAYAETLSGLKAHNLPKDSESGADEQFRKIRDRVAILRRRGRRLRTARWSAAAAVALLAVSSALFLLRREDTPAEERKQITLTLSGGESVILDGSPGALAMIGADNIMTGEDNTLVYNTSSVQGQVVFHKLSIPRGMEHKLKLSDGTLIYLNSDTEIRYPTVFAGGTREIALSGEAYFEVAGNRENPFIVHIGDLAVKVTGTSFNIRAYPGEPTAAMTLEEGAVQFIAGGEAWDITPGVQAIYDNRTGQTELRDVDTRYYTSWKDGYYLFDDMSLEEIMNILAVWYDLDVRFADDGAREIRFGGRFRRYDDIEYLLEKFGYTGMVEFVIEGNRVTITKK